MVGKFSIWEKQSPRRPTSRVKCAENRRVDNCSRLTNACQKREQKNPEGSELTKNGRQHDRKVTNLVAKNEANWLYRQVPIESPL
ncbi:hypothetical protein TNCV_4127241 [Trichonephila clavipes]|uniref:Uncharacterized protein n=1 Tax=Trichonephila clavipes TaxID=2585209 RepID=A0A8X6SST2_TRICX|nr:hypothetical protein TNCV_4127241 [Trichonephila clavipes]